MLPDGHLVVRDRIVRAMRVAGPRGDRDAVVGHLYRLPDWRIIPPSMTYVEPVMYAAASEARKTHSAAISCGLPIRPSGISPSKRLHLFGVLL